MKNFKDFGIKTLAKTFIGEKIPMRKVFDKEITVHHYEIKDSIKKANSKCLHLQISLNDKKHVIFTSSMYLMETIQQIPATGFPFQTIIVEEEKSFQFT